MAAQRGPAVAVKVDAVVMHSLAEEGAFEALT